MVEALVVAHQGTDHAGLATQMAKTSAKFSAKLLGCNVRHLRVRVGVRPSHSLPPKLLSCPGPPVLAVRSGGVGRGSGAPRLSLGVVGDPQEPASRYLHRLLGPTGLQSQNKTFQARHVWASGPSSTLTAHPLHTQEPALPPPRVTGG